MSDALQSAFALCQVPSIEPSVIQPLAEANAGRDGGDGGKVALSSIATYSSAGNPQIAAVWPPERPTLEDAMKSWARWRAAKGTGAAVVLGTGTMFGAGRSMDNRQHTQAAGWALAFVLLEWWNANRAFLLTKDDTDKFVEALRSSSADECAQIAKLTGFAKGRVFSEEERFSVAPGVNDIIAFRIAELQQSVATRISQGRESAARR